MQRLIAIQWPQGDAMLKRKKFTQRKRFMPRADRPMEEPSEGAREHGGGLGGLSGADHQMPAGEGPAQGSGGEATVAVLLEPVQPIRPMLPKRARVRRMLMRSQSCYAGHRKRHVWGTKAKPSGRRGAPTALLFERAVNTELAKSNRRSA